MTSLRLTFLARFAIVTFISAAIAAFLLAFVLEGAHRRALEADETLDAVSRVENLLTPQLDALSYGGSTAVLDSAARAAQVLSFVSGVRVYDDHGRALYPVNAKADLGNITRALVSESVVTATNGDLDTAYAPSVTSDGKHTYVVAVDLSLGQLAARSARERTIVYATTGGGVAIIALSLIALAAGASRELERRRRESQESFVETLGVMARTLDLRDPYTAGHAERVAIYSRELAREMKLPARQVEIIHSGALLHDLGKIAVSDAVLFKPSSLDEEEHEQIRVHPGVGAHILSSIKSMEEVVPCVLHHHEKMGGGGYPHGLIGEAIPLGARIIAVADSFDAMTTDRPYRRAKTVDEAVAELVRCAGTQFDENCVIAFGALVTRGVIVPPPSRAGVTFSRRTIFGDMN
jgi:putative nucleotidyltransferase with HDIG domain